MTEIIPAIIAKDTQDLLEKVSKIPKEIELVHVDVLEEDVWVDIGRDFEAHLMVEDPGTIVNRWIERGAKRIIIHKLDDIEETQVEVGLGVELHVPFEEIFPKIPKVNFVQLMSISEIGEQGHPFEPEIFDRIKEVKEKFPELLISVDGGVNVSNYEKLIEAGANRLVSGSGFKELWQKLQTKK